MINLTAVTIRGICMMQIEIVRTGTCRLEDRMTQLHALQNNQVRPERKFKMES